MVRKFVGPDTHIRKCKGVGALAQGRMYTKAQTKVRWCGYVCMLTRGRKYAGARRMYANVGAQVRKSADEYTVTQGQGMSVAELREGR